MLILVFISSLFSLLFLNLNPEIPFLEKCDLFFLITLLDFCNLTISAIFVCRRPSSRFYTFQRFLSKVCTNSIFLYFLVEKMRFFFYCRWKLLQRLFHMNFKFTDPFHPCLPSFVFLGHRF